ncbi:antibiotic biosynthesis monooxygenase [Nonomuraea sp. LP-02]|uniref:antibiotic biosynthesis monooxygenase n=1 Tax=Nonomuraea sp. LP-02 TaxID=3097960 RepID=UPI002E379B44|nr:antibiotic biosynthesis monooxygenase [Nonomuraea sp. LP-02]MED7929229.1 antibiotic biosynthesis monooxygenase [Nonomuraea sp. LP-02]
MPLITVTRFQIDPADAEQLRARHAALVAATRAAVPGLEEAWLGRVDDEHWAGIWRWDSAASLATARQAVAGSPEAAAAFALTREAGAEDFEILDEH